MNARSTSRVNVRPTFFCADARDPSGSLGGPPLNAADGPKAARLLERCAAGPQLLTEVERPVFVALDDRLGSIAPLNGRLSPARWHGHGMVVGQPPTRNRT